MFCYILSIMINCKRKGKQKHIYFKTMNLCSQTFLKVRQMCALSNPFFTSVTPLSQVKPPTSTPICSKTKQFVQEGT